MAGLRALFANKCLDPATSLGELEPQLVVAVEGKISLVEEAIREEAPGVCRDIEESSTVSCEVTVVDASSERRLRSVREETPPVKVKV